MRTPGLVLVLFALMGCPRLAPGEPCEVTGDSFLTRDPCANQCIVWAIDCVGGTQVTPDVCTGPVCTTDADCQAGFGCAVTGYTDNQCLPSSVCPDGFADTYQNAPQFDLAAAPDQALPPLTK